MSLMHTLNWTFDETVRDLDIIIERIESLAARGGPNAEYSTIIRHLAKACDLLEKKKYVLPPKPRKQ